MKMKSVVTGPMTREEAMAVLMAMVYQSIHTTINLEEDWRVTIDRTDVLISGAVAFNKDLIADAGREPVEHDRTVYSLLAASNIMMRQALKLMIENDGCIGATLKQIDGTFSPVVGTVQ